MDRVELRLSGSGGQGLILAGIILAEAALYDGMNVVHPNPMDLKPETVPVNRRS
ncbi:hypothetical protein [Paratissierella segnis]|uniref:hypothetical protein n=1 Tax=Paratissierella segnis TaxID=2763679 RepID=UPI00223C2E1F|nr:hypothetical protein [Paratissierella segnis]